MSYEFKLKRESLEVGPFRLEIESLRSLDETIDAFFEFLEREGKPELLETLCPYFGVVWPSGLALARAMAALPEPELRGRSVLEIGCGLALPSMICALRGATVVTTDSHPEVPRFLERNRALNGGLPGLHYVEANWDRDGLLSDLSGRRFDWVIGSDILYERAHAERVPRAIAAGLGPGGRAVIADPARPYLQSFVDAMTSQGFAARMDAVVAADKEIFLLGFAR